MKRFFYIPFLFFTLHSIAQNISQKKFSAKEGIATISIIGEYVFKITIEAKQVHEIAVHSKAEGENNENLVLVTEIKNDNLYIAAKMQPLFVDKNDKLSAHKVLSMEINLVIPENLSILVNSYNSDLIVKGQYDDVRVDSDTGNCVFQTFQGVARIITKNGNIAMQTNHAKIRAISKNGTIKKEEIETGNQEVLIKTINGNITLTKSK